MLTRDIVAALIPFLPEKKRTKTVMGIKINASGLHNTPKASERQAEKPHIIRKGNSSVSKHFRNA